MLRWHGGVAPRVYKLKGVGKVDLSWKVSGSSAGIFDVYRGDAGKIARDVKAYSYTDTIGRGASGSYTYQVCEAGSTLACSNKVTVTF